MKKHDGMVLWYTHIPKRISYFFSIESPSLLRLLKKGADLNCRNAAGERVSDIATSSLLKHIRGKGGRRRQHNRTRIEIEVSLVCSLDYESFGKRFKDDMFKRKAQIVSVEERERLLTAAATGGKWRTMTSSCQQHQESLCCSRCNGYLADV